MWDRSDAIPAIMGIVMRHTHTNQQHDNWVCPKHFKFGIVTGEKKTYHANVLPDRNGDGVVEPKICKWENKQGYTHMNYIYI